MRVITHGEYWVNHEKQIQCPECNSNQVDCDISRGSKIGYAIIYIGNCVCLSCGCEFGLERKENVEEIK